MREYEREVARQAKEAKQDYLESRTQEVAALNVTLDERVFALESILAARVKQPIEVDFKKMLTEREYPRLSLGDLANAPTKPHMIFPDQPSPLVRWLPWVATGYRKRFEEARSKFAREEIDYARIEEARLAEIAKKRDKHDRMIVDLKAAESARLSAVKKWMAELERGEPDVTQELFERIQKESFQQLLDGFKGNGKLVYVAESKQLVVEFDLPEFDEAIPGVKAYKYVRATDSISETARPEAQRRALYTLVVAQMVIRVVHEMFSVDYYGHLESIVVNGFVDTIDRGSGQRIRPCLVTVRTTRDIFDGLDLSQVDPIACLRKLNASLSKSPAELAPVRPILEFNMVDPRFIEERDVISTLDHRANLMDLTPSDFESLITNLFEKMGLETKLTQASRDGGVDCIAYDPRPIFGGKVVIQAKRYKNTVGVSAVRDLFGTMQNEGASKGILVTTSGYGKAAFDFANNKPIELLSGSNLLFLLEQHAGITAKIVMPDDWKDPVPDS
ncbi:restriction system protein [Paraburkholderia terricola]|uniref:restriction endonuclease n=1 Tax=Paraburkholderia terricola TaxID=169427 RepID=UPI00285B66E8|nr:restriction endonuclease [Paraburkholderia terricola]MDR6494832.1 restriction system protein [Paraburkholderia terricola]